MKLTRRTVVATAYRRDVLEAARNLDVSVLRWPGGNFSPNYHWTDGIGPRDARRFAPHSITQLTAPLV